jgi:hypothetical protein
MSSDDLDYEAEYEAVQARLLPLAEHILTQLDEARELANRQKAKRGNNEWLNALDTHHQDIRPLLSREVSLQRLRCWSGVC